MVFIQYNEYENMDVLCKIYEKAGYTISERDIKPAYMNTEGMDRTILKWTKQVGNKNIVCISEIANIPQTNSSAVIDLNACFYKK